MTEKPIIELDEIKQHLRLDHDYDDDLLTAYSLAAIEAAQNYIGKEFDEEHTTITVKFTNGIRIGCLMFIAHLYANRESVTDVQQYEVPMSVTYLWKPYREPCFY